MPSAGLGSSCSCSYYNWPLTYTDDENHDELPESESMEELFGAYPHIDKPTVVDGNVETASVFASSSQREIPSYSALQVVAEPLVLESNISNPTLHRREPASTSTIMMRPSVGVNTHHLNSQSAQCSSSLASPVSLPDIAVLNMSPGVTDSSASSYSSTRKRPLREEESDSGKLSESTDRDRRPQKRHHTDSVSTTISSQNLPGTSNRYHACKTVIYYRWIYRTSWTGCQSDRVRIDTAIRTSNQHP